MAIVIDKLFKAFGERQVLENFSAQLPEKGVAEITGRSGSGKTTLLRILMGLETADSGEIRGLNEQKIGAVFQEDRLLSHMSAVDNVRFVCDCPREEILRHLDEVGLSEQALERVSRYSGGMKRRVAIVRAVMYPCNVLILDEPFKGMDEVTRAQVMDYVLRHSQDRLILLVSHDREEGRAMGAAAHLEIGGDTHD